MTTPRIILVACGAGKRRDVEAIEARSLYTGQLTRARIQHAETQDAPWRILSGLHGLVEAGTILAPYDWPLAAQTPRYKRLWAAAVTDALLDQHEAGTLDLAGSIVEMHAGRVYRDTLASSLDAYGVTVEAPLAGLGIGQQLAWYAQRRQVLA